MHVGSADDAVGTDRNGVGDDVVNGPLHRVVVAVIFTKIMMMLFLVHFLYQDDLLQEETILAWYKKIPHPKCREKVEPFINWLLKEEEESSEDDEESD